MFEADLRPEVYELVLIRGQRHMDWSLYRSEMHTCIETVLKCMHALELVGGLQCIHALADLKAGRASEINLSAVYLICFLHFVHLTAFLFYY